MSRALHGKSWPRYVVLDTAKELKVFKMETDNIFNLADVTEIITQICDVSLNNNPEALSTLPLFHRLINQSFISDPFIVMQVKKAIAKLGNAIYSALCTYGANTETGIPYVFDRFVNNDIVLSHMPY